MTLPARYPAPYAEQIFSDEAKIRRWAEWTRKFLQLKLEGTTKPIFPDSDLYAEYITTELPTPEAVATREASTGHDVVAFLSVLTQEMSPALKRHIHYGLTSSDLVENAHHDALRIHAEAMVNMVEILWDLLNRWDQDDTPRAGRTHGQIAAPTTFAHQMSVHRSVLGGVQGDLRGFSRYKIVKSVGPTGMSPFRDLGEQVGDRFVVPSTQIIPRDYQVDWASIYLRLAGVLENLALFVRLGARSEIAEIAEGPRVRRVGSSAMPHKNNPIDSEKVCGLARVARGHFMAIAEGQAVWEERDLTNSSVERISVPDLAATVEHMTQTMTNVIMHLKVDVERMLINIQDTRTMSNIFQTVAQDVFGIGPIEASELVRLVVRFDDVGPYGPKIDANNLPWPATTEQLSRWMQQVRVIWQKTA